VQDRAADRHARMTVRRFPSNAAANAHDLEYWTAIPPDRRLEMVWDLTLDMRALQGQTGDQPRLQRSVCRVERRGR
jgi:hypothetical protein